MKNKEFSGRRPQHIVAKIVCLLLAVVIWLYVMYVDAPIYEEVYEGVSVTVHGDATAWQIQDDTISIRVRGTKQELATYSAQNIEAYILPSDEPDALLIDQGSGLYSFPIRFKLPGALTVKDDYAITVRKLGGENG